MMQTGEEIRTTQLLPPGRARMRYLKLKGSAGNEVVGTGTTTIRCAACAATMLASVRPESLEGLAIKCPACGAVSSL